MVALPSVLKWQLEGVASKFYKLRGKCREFTGIAAGTTVQAKVWVVVKVQVRDTKSDELFMIPVQCLVVSDLPIPMIFGVNSLMSVQADLSVRRNSQTPVMVTVVLVNAVRVVTPLLNVRV